MHWSPASVRFFLRVSFEILNLSNYEIQFLQIFGITSFFYDSGDLIG